MISRRSMYTRRRLNENLSWFFLSMVFCSSGRLSASGVGETMREPSKMEVAVRVHVRFSLPRALSFPTRMAYRKRVRSALFLLCYISMYSCYDVISLWLIGFLIYLYRSGFLINLVSSWFLWFSHYIFTLPLRFLPLRYTWVTCSLVTCSNVHGTVPAQIFKVF